MCRVLLILGMLVLGTPLHAQWQIRQVADSLFIPWGMAFDAEGSLWFTQKNGYLCRLDPGSGTIDTLLFESEVELSSEGGMLDLVLHPDFPQTPFLYIAYNYEDGGMKLKVQRYEYQPGIDQVRFSRLLIDGIQGGAYHNGCRLVIHDEHLYITTGEAGKPALSQDLSSLNGKTLRIGLDGRIPLDNPVPLSPIWTWGHRNAQGMALVDGLILQSEHGPNQDDEINWILPGGNYGWPYVEGFCDLPSEIQYCQDSNVVEPLFSWTPTLAVGDLVYYDQDQFPQWKGSLLLATLKAEKLFQLKLNSSHTSIDTVMVIPGLNLGRIRALAISPEGSLFLSTSLSPSLGTGPFRDQIWEVFDPHYVPKSVPRETGLHSPSVFPNPCHDRLYVDFPPSFTGQIPIQLFDTYGRKVYTGIHHGGRIEISMDLLPAGLYLLRTGGENLKAPWAKRIIKR